MSKEEEETPVGWPTRAEFAMTTVYGFKTRLPYVDIHFNEKPLCQIEARDAVDLAVNLIRVAGMSIADAFVFEFAKQVTEGDEQAAASMVVEFRDWRRKSKMDQERGQKTSGKPKKGSTNGNG